MSRCWLTTGQLAKAGGVTPEAIRYYEQRRLLSHPPRSASGYRLYPVEEVRRIRFIKQAQGMGFTLEEIADLLSLRSDPQGCCGQVKAKADDKIVDIDQRIASLQHMKRALELISSVCLGTGPVSECPILDALETEKGQPWPRSS